MSRLAYIRPSVPSPGCGLKSIRPGFIPSVTAIASIGQPSGASRSSSPILQNRFQLAVDMAEGKLYHDTELKDKLAAAQPYGDWIEKIVDLNSLLRDVPEAPLFTGAELRKRQIAAGYTVEELEQVLAPMAEDGKEMVASMGDDTPAAVLSSVYRPLSHFFRQNFSQVTNPPIDSLREGRVMSLKTRFGNLRNVLDENSSQTEILVLESPFIANAEFDVMVKQFGDQVAFIDCTFPVGPSLDDLRVGLWDTAVAYQATKREKKYMGKEREAKWQEMLQAIWPPSQAARLVGQSAAAMPSMACLESATMVSRPLTPASPLPWQQIAILVPVTQLLWHSASHLLFAKCTCHRPRHFGRQPWVAPRRCAETTSVIFLLVHAQTLP